MARRGAALLRHIRLLPIVIVAAGAMLSLKLLGIAVGPQAQFTGSVPVLAQDADTGEGDPTGASEDLGALSTEAPGEPVVDVTTAAEETGGVRAAADTLAERLSERREALDARESELDLRENLLAATEQRIEERVSELKQLEARLNQLIEERDEAEAARFQNLVAMYENMKPKDAAKVFEGLDTRILVEVAADIDPRRMGEIVAKMSADAAQRLTIALMNKSVQDEAPLSVEELPQIIGTPDAG